MKKLFLILFLLFSPLVYSPAVEATVTECKPGSGARWDYTGNGSTTAFPYTCKIYDADDLKVIKVSTAGVAVTQVRGTHYTVSGVDSASGGNVTFTTAPATGERISILRLQKKHQQSDYIPGQAFPSDSVEKDLDKIVMQLQQHDEILRRVPKLREHETHFDVDLDDPGDISVVPSVTVANLPVSPAIGAIRRVTDGTDTTDCTTGGGSTIVTYCEWDGTAWVFTGTAGGGGSGDVVGPASSVNDNVVFFSGTTGKLIKDSGFTLSGSNTGDQTSIVGITGTTAEFNTALSDGSFATGGGTATGTNTGDQTITLTGDVTGSGTGSFAATIAADSIGTSELDDGADTPLSGEYVRVDTVDQAGFEYRTTAEVLSDLAPSFTDISGTATDGQIPTGVTRDSEVQSGAPVYCAGASGTDTYTCSLGTALTAYTNGMIVPFEPDVSNTGAATLNIDSVGAIAIKLLDGVTDPSDADLVAGEPVKLFYNGTVFLILGPLATPAANHALKLDGTGKFPSGALTEVFGLTGLNDVTAKQGNSTTVQMQTGAATSGNLPKWDANGNLVDSGIVATGFTFVRKTADETVNNSSVRQADDHLTTSIAANETRLITFMIKYSSNTTADFEGDISGPSGIAGVVYAICAANSQSFIDGNGDWRNYAFGDVFTCGGGTGEGTVIIKVLARNGATAGNVALNWAQRVADVSDTKVFIDSFIISQFIQ